MKTRQKPNIYKTKSIKQRSDVVLNKKIAGALVQMILSGNNLFGREGKELGLRMDDELILISKNTVKSWISRGNVVPETGEILRDILERAKIEYRTNEREKRKSEMLAGVDRHFSRMLNLRTNRVKRNKNGEIIKDAETGLPVKDEDVGLLKLKNDVARFIGEKLDPKTYGKIEQGEKPNFFSLSDLRRISEERERTKQY